MNDIQSPSSSVPSQPVLHYRVDDIDNEPPYTTLIGPSGFECTLTESEDRTWTRDLGVVLARLNAQHEELLIARDLVAKLQGQVAFLNEVRVSTVEVSP